MFETTKVKCPSCGAGLEVTRGATAAKCAYCEQTSMVAPWGGAPPPTQLGPGAVRPPVVQVASGRQVRFIVLGILLVTLAPVCGGMVKVGFALRDAFVKVNGAFDDVNDKFAR